MVVQIPLVHAGLTVQVQTSPNAIPTDVGAAKSDLDRAVGGEQVRETVPLERGQVIAVTHLQILELSEVLEQSDAVLEIVGALLERRTARTARRDGRKVGRFSGVHRCAHHRISIVKGRNGNPLDRFPRRVGLAIRRQRGLQARARSNGLAPPILVRRIHRREEVHLADLPKAALLDVLVLEDARSPFVKPPRLRGLAEKAPTSLGTLAVGGDVHDRLQLHLIDQPPGLWEFRTDLS